MGSLAGGEGLLRRSDGDVVRARQPARPERLPGRLLHHGEPQRLDRHLSRRSAQRQRGGRYAAARVRPQAGGERDVAIVPLRDPQRLSARRAGDRSEQRRAHAEREPAGTGAHRRDLSPATGGGAGERSHSVRPVQPAVSAAPRSESGRSGARSVHRVPAPRAVCRFQQADGDGAQRFAVSHAPRVPRHAGTAVGFRAPAATAGDHVARPLDARAEQLPDPRRQRADLRAQHPAHARNRLHDRLHDRPGAVQESRCAVSGRGRSGTGAGTVRRARGVFHRAHHHLRPVGAL